MAELTKKAKSVATILEREIVATIKEWLRRMNLLRCLADPSQSR